MIEKLWTRNDLLIFTSNSVVRKDGRLVMGKGIAKVVRDNLEPIAKQCDIDEYYGSLVKEYGNRPFIVRTTAFGLEFLNEPQYIMSFPTKHHWRDKSSLELIRKSRKLAVQEIKRFLESDRFFREGVKRVLCPLWGTENGGLSIEDVREELLAFKKEVEALGLEVKFFNRNGFVEIDGERIAQRLPAHRIGILGKTAEEKFKVAWEHAKAVSEACKLIGKNCIEPFNRAIEEFERDLNEIRELAGFEGKVELPRLERGIPEEVIRFEREIIPWAIRGLQKEAMKKSKEKEVEVDREEDSGLEL